MPKYPLGPYLVIHPSGHKTRTPVKVNDPEFGTHPNGLHHWIDCVLVLDSENLSVVDQVVGIMIQASITIHRCLVVFFFWEGSMMHRYCVDTARTGHRHGRDTDFTHRK